MPDLIESRCDSISDVNSLREFSMCAKRSMCPAGSMCPSQRTDKKGIHIISHRDLRARYIAFEKYIAFAKQTYRI